METTAGGTNRVNDNRPNPDFLNPGIDRSQMASWPANRAAEDSTKDAGDQLQFFARCGERIFQPTPRWHRNRTPAATVPDAAQPISHWRQRRGCPVAMYSRAARRARCRVIRVQLDAYSVQFEAVEEDRVGKFWQPSVHT